MPIVSNNILIPGKWYKGDSNYYMKYSHTEIVEGKFGNHNRLFFNERIYSSGYRVGKDYWSNSDWEKNMVKNGPIDISEIAHLLPKGHPDLNTEPTYEIY